MEKELEMVADYAKKTQDPFYIGGLWDHFAGSHFVLSWSFFWFSFSQHGLHLSSILQQIPQYYYNQDIIYNNLNTN